MTLKYESEILFDLMKRDGDDAPSGVLPYESELKEKYLKQVEGAYPKLIDYRSEWLNYNLYNHLPADFPMETLSDVTNATVHNVVPYTYRTAILKGNTDENLQSVKMPELTTTGKNLLCVGRGLNDTITYKGLTITRDAVNQTLTINGTATEDNTSQPLEILLYREIKKDERYALSCYLVSGTADRITFRTHEKKWSASMTCELNKPSYKTIDKDVVFNDCSFRVDSGATFKNAVFKVMFEKIDVNSNTTSYEPYKSNILTVNEDVTLCGIGDVKDELNLLTGELTKRIGEVVLDGSDDETWQDFVNKASDNTVAFSLPKSFIQFRAKTTAVLSDKYQFNGSVYNLDDECMGINGDDKHHIQLRISKSKASNIKELKAYLSSNPIKVQGVLETESNKTVELNCINEQGESVSFRPFEGTMHIMTNGTPIKPTATIEVPVEAITQNLMSFANIVEEEK